MAYETYRKQRGPVPKRQKPPQFSIDGRGVRLNSRAIALLIEGTDVDEDRVELMVDREERSFGLRVGHSADSVRFGVRSSFDARVRGAFVQDALRAAGWDGTPVKLPAERVDGGIVAVRFSPPGGTGVPGATGVPPRPVLAGSRTRESGRGGNRTRI